MPACCGRGGAQLIYIALFLSGFYLASREWELYLTTLNSYLNFEGVIAGGLALILVKTAHELGHGYAAVACGCRVHSMGLAFMVMAPMPYTDVTDAWRVTDRRKRLAIDCAGVATEAAVASVALFLWAFLPNGPLRNAMFVLSAVSLVSSLVVNVNPLMRFDGYYITSELTGVENLQARSFSVGKWKLREFLFGLDAPCPEVGMSPARIWFLVVYAWAAWLYRLVLFTGIALLVYHYFFKVLGLVLFLIEIVYFIAWPIASELAAWVAMRRQIAAKGRFAWPAAIAGAGLAAAMFPISTTIEVPAIMEARQVQSIYPVREARITEVHVRHGDPVDTGSKIATLTSPELEAELERTRISLRGTEVQFARRGSDPVDREGSLMLARTIESLRAKVAGLEKERGELTVASPFAGRIADFNAELHAGRWISRRDQIAVVAGGGGTVARGYVAEADVGRLEPGAAAVFIPEHVSRPSTKLRLEDIAVRGATQIEVADLASTYGGSLPVNQDDKRRLIPATAQYFVVFSALDAVIAPELAIRGIVLAKGRAESLLAKTWRRALSVIRRESGF